MNKWKMLGALTLAVGLVLAGTASGAIIRVHPDTLVTKAGWTNSISSAIDSTAYDTIFVYPDTFNLTVEGSFPITVDRSLVIQSTGGANNTVIDASTQSGGVAIGISADDVTFEGFTVVMPTPSGFTCGIRVSAADSATVTNNIISAVGNVIGINLVNVTTNATVSDNRLDSCSIYLDQGVTHCTISDNEITKQSISLEDSVIDITVSGNTISGAPDNGAIQINGDWGTAGARRDSILIEGNTISNNLHSGIWLQTDAVGNATHVRIVGNDITDNIDDGIHILDWDATTDSIYSNNISGNAMGVNNAIPGVAFSVVADSNWWGNASGPTQATTNPHGTGNAVSDSVTYIPWLAASGGAATGGIPATLLISASPTSVQVGGVTSAIEATLTDILGNPISDIAMNIQSDTNAYIDFSVIAGNGTRSPAADTTDDLGHATTTFTSGSIAAINKVRGTLRGSSITGTVNIAVTPGPLARVETTPVSTHAVVVGDVNIVAELMDTYRNHIDATDTSEADFTATGGSIGPRSVISDKIQMVYTTCDSIVLHTITATTETGGYTDITEVTTYGDAPATMTFTADDSTVVVSDTTNTEVLSIALFDEYDNPSAYSDYDASEMYEVIFTWSTGAGIVDPDTVPVNTDGEWTGNYKSSTVIGDYTVTATSGDATASLGIAQTADVLAAVDLTPATTSCVAGQDVTLTAELQDQFGNHINGDAGDVVFSIVSGLGSLGSETVGTDSTISIPYTTYTSDVDTAEIEVVATTFKDTSTVISGLAGALDHFALTCSAESLDVGTAVTVTITAKDIADIRIYTYDNDDIITLELDESAADPSQVGWVIDTDTTYGLTAEIPESSFTSGQFSFTVFNELAEAVTVTAVDTAGITGTSETITWIPVTLNYFGVVAQSDPIYTGVPFTFTVTPYDTFNNVTSWGLPVWIEFSANELGVALPTGPQKLTATTAYSAIATNPSGSLQVTVMTTDGLIFGVSAPITVIGLYTLSGTVGLSDNPGDLRGTRVMVTGGFFDSTDVLGHYEIPGLLAGTYNIIVTHEGYGIVFETGVVISANIVKNFMLQRTVGIEEIPTVSFLSQNKPNPFASGTTIEYGITKAGNVEIAVYNVVGQKVRTLVSAEEKAGYHKVNWDGTNDSGAKVGGGIYFYKITAGEFTNLKKLILLR
ncbi:MAG: right-handed parallel beta-helix repeat-containing protein [bacterium]|nr:right-handed parallel beta-helix repeat-containing protein [bacterium]